MAPKKSNREKMQSYIHEFGGYKTFSTEGKMLFCKLCETAVSCERKSLVRQHVQTEKHQQKQAEFAEGPTPAKQQLLTEEFMQRGGSVAKEFKRELCSNMMAADIAFNKLKHKGWRQFLQKWTGQQVPDESTLRKLYVEPEYEKCLQNIRDAIGNRNIWVQTDTVTDAAGLHID